ncbi:MAG: enoyl-CoA hydratase/isomerase family protein, partial [Candidatus Cybelea sp.]
MIPVAPHPRDGSVAVITLDNPPVNALSFSYCARLIETLEAAHADDAVQAVVFTGANGLFSAGADVNDFNRELPRNAVTIRDVIAAIEASVKVHVAAIDGNCLGGGF